QSKLANLLFMFELGRRAPDVLSVACHPGYSSTNLLGAEAKESGSRLREAFWGWTNATIAQSSHAGALPTVYAAVKQGLSSGDYVGPSGPFEIVGAPKRVRVAKKARDPEVAARLWALSEELTGEPFAL
ncbi:MAG: short-chain dehydrogenase, partial [Myxococcales bacterium]|nr:short-chain dehydrogenase [Myxococcales bacterium]